jgi:hypothetical protein
MEDSQPVQSRSVLDATRVLAAGLVAAALAACDEPRERIGVELQEGIVAAEYKHCRDSGLVHRVTLKDLGETRTDTSDDRALWEVVSSSGSRLTRYTVGSTPDGFEQLVQLSEPLDGLLLNIQFKSSALPAGESVTFTIPELRAGTLRVGTEYMSAEEFRSEPACD